jgi:nitronate monooxygenase
MTDMASLKYDKRITMATIDGANLSWRLTRAAQLLGIEYPIIQAPFGGLASQRLTAEVSNLGGLGSLGAVTLEPAAISEAIDEIRDLTARPFAINLWVSTSDRDASRASSQKIEEKIREFEQYYSELGIDAPMTVKPRFHDFEAQSRAAIDARPPVLSFVYGIPPAEILSECRRQQIKTIGTATTPEEAVALEHSGVDAIVASGFEGGGHRGSFLRPAKDSLIGSISLIPQVVDAVSVPVIAAGGIADGRGVVAAFALGAEGVQIGTAFLSCSGSGATAAYQNALNSDAAKWTGLTDGFTGRLARGIRNRLMDHLTMHSGPPLPFPLQHALTQTVASVAAAQTNTELMTLWAGQSAGLSHCTEASEFLSNLLVDVDCCLSKLMPTNLKTSGATDR